MKNGKTCIRNNNNNFKKVALKPVIIFSKMLLAYIYSLCLIHKGDSSNIKLIISILILNGLHLKKERPKTVVFLKHRKILM